MFKDPLTANEIALIVCGAFALALSILFRRKNREIFVQLRRYEAFAIRDAFVRMRILGRIPEESFRDLMDFCNKALLVSEHIDLRHFYGAVIGISNKTKNAEFSRKMVELSRNDVEFAKQFNALLRYVLGRTIKNSIRRSLEIIAHIKKQEEQRRLQRAVGGYNQIRNFHRDFRLKIA